MALQSELDRLIYQRRRVGHCQPWRARDVCSDQLSNRLASEPPESIVIVPVRTDWNALVEDGRREPVVPGLVGEGDQFQFLSTNLIGLAASGFKRRQEIAQGIERWTIDQDDVEPEGGFHFLPKPLSHDPESAFVNVLAQDREAGVPGSRRRIDNPADPKAMRGEPSFDFLQEG